MTAVNMKLKLLLFKFFLEPSFLIYTLLRMLEWPSEQTPSTCATQYYSRYVIGLSRYHKKMKYKTLTESDTING